MRLLITGATGFVGGAVARMAVAAGHTVAALTRTTPPGEADSIHWLKGTLAEPPLAALEAFSPDACIHSAWIATPGVYLESPENAALARDSLSFLRALAGLGMRHCTVIGTCIEYAPSNAPVQEDTSPVAPPSPYAQAKHALHEALLREFAGGATDLAWARLFYPYGAGEHPSRLPSALIRSLRRGEPLALKTPDSVKDYIHISDTAAALLRILKRRAAGSINIGTGSGITVEGLARIIAGRIGRPELVSRAATPAPDPYPHVVADSTRLRSLGWAPRISLQDGIDGLVASL